MKTINSSIRSSMLERLGAALKPKHLSAFKRLERRQVRARGRQFMIREELPMALELLADQFQIESNVHANFARKMKRKVKHMVDQVVSQDPKWLDKHLVVQEVCISYIERGRNVCEKRMQSRAYCG